MAMSRRHDDGLARWSLILAVITALFFLVLSRSDARLGQPAAHLTDAAVSPIAGLMSRPVRGVENLIFGVKDRSRAFEENKALKAELRELRERQARIDVMKIKMARYEQMLSAPEASDLPLTKIVARAVTETQGPFVQSLLINAGTSKGVRRGNPVMSAEGLVGHVTRSGTNSSRVLMLGDLSSRIAVMTASGDMRAILSGDNTARPKLSYKNGQTAWTAGTAIITSGDDGMLPRGLRVGQVVQDQRGVWRVKLGVEGQPIDWVWVSPYVPIAAPIETAENETLENEASQGDVSENAAPESGPEP